MTQRTLMNKVNRLKALDAEKKSIEKQMEALQGEIKAELQDRGTDETTVGDWMMRFENKVIHVTGTLVFLRNGKGRYKDTPKTESSRRDIPMLGNVERMFKQLQKTQLETKLLLGDKWKEADGLENLVLTYEDGGALWDTGIRVDMKKVVDSINSAGTKMEMITPHTFRHTFATRGLEQAIDLKMMQTILGHSSLSVTADLYSHVLPDTKAAEMKKLEGIV